ncbi:30S ribosomal protein S17 [[Eubacterium] cellulosolvens]
MTSAQSPETVLKAGADEKTGKGKKSEDKKETVKKSKGKSKTTAKTDKSGKDKEAKEEAPAPMKKKRATAKAIEKTQAKRLVKPKRAKRTGKRKIVRAVEPKKKTRDIGVDVILPEASCDDPFCPFHGTLPVRGQILTGIVVSSKMDKTTIVQREIMRLIPKYERYEKRTHNYAVHNPPCLNVQRGDLVKIMECRPLSKSKSFVIIEKS